ncbi:protein LAZY 1-like [Rhodamnia argentea]|uniref:Protein LAZY 1-like n=1 Tax=Rhodamnia argentea TaxID=178133 RepID=A0A8B8Q4T9_9MYRT|nr:protein LAZY 1-like [Rhodamnia argentea]
MKLLGWMHRKFRQTGSEPLKDLVIGNPCNCLSGKRSTDDQEYYQHANYGTKPAGHAQQENQLRKSFACLEAARAEYENRQEEQLLADEAQIFPGFLAIGTLGSDTPLSDPSTPTFANSVDYLTEKETEMTENELRLINDELEKVLVAEAKEESGNDSSGRSSLVSTGRSSHCSTITLCGKPILEGQETNNGSTNTVYPLQGYLFGSAIELSETTAAVKKEHRTSLGELFQRSKLTEAGYESKPEREERHTAMHLMKKKLKKRILLPCGSSTATAGMNIDSTSAETKFQKILQMFHRKVHPESSASTRKTEKRQQRESKKKTTQESRKKNRDQELLQNKPPQFKLAGSESNGNRECWIKTDADYLVLEL